jgi:cytidine deaminase
MNLNTWVQKIDQPKLFRFEQPRPKLLYFSQSRRDSSVVLTQQDSFIGQVFLNQLFDLGQAEFFAYDPTTQQKTPWVQSALSHRIDIETLQSLVRLAQLKAELAPNLLATSFGAAVLLQDGTLGAGNNVVFAPSDTICAERAALSDAFQQSTSPFKLWNGLFEAKAPNNLLDKIPHVQHRLTTPVRLNHDPNEEPSAVKAIAIVHHNPKVYLATANAVNAPCEICLQSFVNDPRVIPDTLVLAPFLPKEADAKIQIYVMTMEQLIPQTNFLKLERGQNRADQKIYIGPPIYLSSQAERFVTQVGHLSRDRLKSILDDSLTAALKEKSQIYERKRVPNDRAFEGHLLPAVGIAMYVTDKQRKSPPLIASGSTLYASDRFTLTAERDAISQMFNKRAFSPRKDDWELKLVTYTGNQLPQPSELGFIRKIFSSDDFLVAIHQGQALHVFHLKDYLPLLYNSRDKLNGTGRFTPP